ncbi:MAG TPA: DUF447 family protein [Methanocorpusculum sp.]|nr:DUF447 family protein [Methanocorpusculum sp.]
MELGLVTEGITEVIAVTKDNAAPIGIILREGQCPKMILFKGSKTEENIRRYGWVSANFVSDVYLYPKYAFSDAEPDELVPAGAYQRLKAADAYIIYRASVVHETEQTYMVDLTPAGDEVILHPQVRRVNRGFDAVLDATVHATRYAAHHDAVLLERIRYDLDLVRKCGGRREIEAAALISSVCGLENK